MLCKTVSRPGVNAPMKKAPIYMEAAPASFYLSRWLRQHEQEPVEVAAAACLRDINANPDNAGPALERLQALEREGSVLATYCLGLWQLEGRLLAEDPEAGRELLERACEQSFPLAYEPLIRHYRSRPQPDVGRAEHLLAQGARLGVPYCVLERARAVCDCTLHLDVTAAMKLAEQLMECIRDGSWEALLQLLQICLDERLEGEQNAEIGLVALDTLRDMAIDGWAPAMTRLGWLHRQGDVLPMDLDKAEEWFTRAWQKEDMQGGFYLAELLLRSADSVPEETAKALEILHQCSLMGMPQADTLKAEYLMSARGRKGDAALAFRLYAKAARNGLPEPGVQCLWFRLHMAETIRERRAVLQDMKNPVFECPTMQCLRAMLRFNGLDCRPPSSKEGITMLRALADKNDLLAMTKLAEIFIFGLYGVQKSAKKGRPLLEKAFDRRYPRAMSLMAYLALTEPANFAIPGNGERSSIPKSPSGRQKWVRGRRYPADVSRLFSRALAREDMLARLNIAISLEPSAKTPPEEAAARLDDMAHFFIRALLDAVRFGDVMLLLILGDYLADLADSPQGDILASLCWQKLDIEDQGNCSVLACYILNYARLYGEPRAVEILDARLLPLTSDGIHLPDARARY